MEEWFSPRKEVQFDLRPYFRAPPVLTARQRLLYGLDRYGPSSAVPRAPSSEVGIADEARSAPERTRRWQRSSVKDKTTSTASHTINSRSEGCQGPKEKIVDGYCMKPADAEHVDTSKSSNAAEVRKLKKALREIDELQCQQACGQELRCNQLQKIGRKEAFEERLRQLGA